MKTNRSIKKSNDKWDNPYKIIRVYKRLYLLKLLTNFKIFFVFHNSLFRFLYRSPGLLGQNTINNIKSRYNQNHILEKNNKTNKETEH